ncbi:MAG: biopolymer transporter ExbD [Spirochaetes bacterium]|nr:biopolymer transporter ExbD [Spirochaetota bacterium]
MNPILIKKRKRKDIKSLNREIKQFDSTSIGDMAFLLLIFFIVTGSFMVRQGLFLSLPSKSAGSVHVSEDRIIEIIPNENSYTCDDEVLSSEQLAKKLNIKKGLTDDTVVLIRMQARIRYERMIDTLSIVKESGIKKISVKMIEEL